MPPKTKVTAHLNPNESKVQAIALAGPLSQEALRLSNLGDHKGAEQIHLQILNAKLPAFGPDSPEVALTKNGLGEEQLRLGKLDEAEENLREAVRVRNTSSRVNAFDAAVSRENLAQVLEAKGDLAGAKEVRRSAGPQTLTCSYYSCPGQTFKLSQLKVCGGCHSPLYCSTECQKKDWKERHKVLCKKA